MQVLAVGAHPDDLEIFMFGTLAAYAAMGVGMTLAIATDGARGGSDDSAGLAQTRKRETTEALASIGTAPVFLDFPDGELIADNALVAGLRSLIASCQPDIILTHAPNDYHGDHRALAEAMGVAASFFAPVLYVDTFMGVGFVPTHYVDISDHMDAKIAAIRAHASQDPERFVNSTRLQNGFRAKQCNGDADSYAEAYRFEPIFPFADIRNLLPPAPKVRPVVNRNQVSPQPIRT